MAGIDAVSTQNNHRMGDGDELRASHLLNRFVSIESTSEGCRHCKGSDKFHRRILWVCCVTKKKKELALPSPC